MKRVMLFCVLILLAFNLFGQSPRLIGMGNVNGYITDDSDIFTYPATINSYTNTVYGYMCKSPTEGNSYNFGFNYELAKAILGVYLNKPLPSFAMNNSVIFQNGLSLDHNFQMLLGFNENLALSFSLAMDSYVDDENDDIEIARVLGLGFGYSVENFDLGVNMLLPAYLSEVNGGEEEIESKFMLDLNGRNVFIQKEKSQLVGKFELGLGAQTYDNGVSGADEEILGYLDISFGIAEVVNLDENNIVVMGITPFGFLSQSSEYGDDEATTTYLTLPAFNIGFESKVCKWLVLRSGFEQVYYVVNQTSDNGSTETSTSHYSNDFVYNMGLGIVYKNFTMDCVFNKDFLHNGVNFITGETTSNIFGEIMINYDF